MICYAGQFLNSRIADETAAVHCRLGAATWPLLVRAQQQTKPTIGWLDVQLGRQPGFVEGFRLGLEDVGFSVGRDVTVEYHTAEGHNERLPALAADLVRRRPAAIFAPADTAALAAKAATRETPIIFLTGSDPVELGLVAGLNRPGGNLTGVALLGAENAEKRLDLLHKAVPATDIIGLLVADGAYSQVETRHVQSAARSLGLRLLVFNVTADTEITPVFAALVEHRPVPSWWAVVSLSLAKRDQILSHAARFALPTMFLTGRDARAGALCSYSYRDLPPSGGIYRPDS